ncbi:MAG: hypothetical protein K2I96_04140 [Lachnospiraceae bacterium]|nr:hypothetical protein [Lachnospiraceae bacterium]
MGKIDTDECIAVETPILRQMEQAIVQIYLDLSMDEMKDLQAEIQSVTESNCDFKVYDIAQMMKGYVDTAINGI